MNKQKAIQSMIPPGQLRPGKPLGGVIQIWTTRRCENACHNCTQGANLKGDSGFISLEHFEQACESLTNYFGIVGIFGGNPALHPQFKTLCQILKKHIPHNRRGIWCNHPHGYGKTMAETFNSAVSNLNVHLNNSAFLEFKKDWPNCRPFGRTHDSRHSPPFVAIQDVVSEEAQQWDYISNCDINQHWSAMICSVNNKLRGFFCEIAGAQAILHQNDKSYPDLGVPVEPNWWKRPIEDFQQQIEFHCMACGVPLRGYGSLAQDPHGVSQYSKTHEAIYKPKDHEALLICNIQELGNPLKKSTHYLQNAKAK